MCIDYYDSSLHLGVALCPTNQEIWERHPHGESLSSPFTLSAFSLPSLSASACDSNIPDAGLCWSRAFCSQQSHWRGSLGFSWRPMSSSKPSTIGHLYLDLSVSLR